MAKNVKWPNEREIVKAIVITHNLVCGDVTEEQGTAIRNQDRLYRVVRGYSRLIDYIKSPGVDYDPDPPEVFALVVRGLTAPTHEDPVFDENDFLIGFQLMGSLLSACGYSMVKDFTKRQLKHIRQGLIVGDSKKVARVFATNWKRHT